MVQINQKKVATHFSEKCRIDGQTSSSDFIEPSVGQGSKKIKFGKVRLPSRGKNNVKPNPFIKTMVHRSNTHYSEMYQTEN